MKGREFRGVWNEKMRRMWLEREIVVADPFPSLISINRLYKLILQRLINIYLVHNKRKNIKQKIIVAKSRINRKGYKNKTEINKIQGKIRK